MMRFAVFPAFLLLASCGCGPEGAALQDADPAPSLGPVGPVTLVYTGRGEGEIEPCG